MSSYRKIWSLSIKWKTFIQDHFKKLVDRLQNYFEEGYNLLLSALAGVLIFILSKIGFNYINELSKWLSSIDLESIKFFGKSAWDWTDLLIVPLILSIVGFFGKHFLEKQENDRKKQEALKDYLSQVGTLFIRQDWPSLERKNNIIMNSQERKIVAIVHARTLAVFREIDNTRKTELLRFLEESDTIRNIDFEGVDLRGVELTNIDLSKTNLKGADLRGTVFRKVNFNGAKLCNANFADASLSEVDFNGANLSSVNFAWSTIENSSFRGANLLNAYFEHSYLRKVSFSKADLSRAELILLRQIEIDFTDSIMINAVLEEVSLRGISFRGANLQKAIIRKVLLDNCDFTNSNLEGISWEKQDNWENSIGLEFAVNVPHKLMKKYMAS